MRYEILITEPASAQANMDRDLALLESLLDNPRCIIHFYEWQQTSATYGYFIDPDKFFKKEGLVKYGLQLARRPTGGGIIFHTYDLAFSLLIPSTYVHYTINPLKNYLFINKIIKEALADPTLEFYKEDPPRSKTAIDSFCMAKPVLHDIMGNGRKVVGGAQRRMKQGFLHQATVALAAPEELFLHDLLQEGDLIARTMALYSPIHSSQNLQERREQLRFSLLKTIKIGLGL